MSNSLMDDAFGHHTWATLQVIDACLRLTPEQLDTTVPGTYGSILETLRHLAGADTRYLFDITKNRDLRRALRMSLYESEPKALREAIEANGAAWSKLLAAGFDSDEVVRETDEEDGYQRDATMGIRLAQALDHGTTHRSQICTVLTTLGLEPPEIDVWDFGDETGRAVDVPPAT